MFSKMLIAIGWIIRISEISVNFSEQLGELNISLKDMAEKLNDPVEVYDSICIIGRLQIDQIF